MIKSRHNLLSTYEFELPPEQIAQHPTARRDESRLLVVPAAGPVVHRHFRDILDLLQPGDLLVRNNTRVLPARLIGTRDTGGRVELLLLEPTAVEGVRWRAMVKPGRATGPGRKLHFGELHAIVTEKHEDGTIDVSFPVAPEKFDRLLAREGRMPLPPYIHRDDEEAPRVLAADRERYQTVYAAQDGAMAAPTAGLHFTDAFFAQIAAHGVEVIDLTLHVGAGTFLPVRSERLDEHVMHCERFVLTADAAAKIQAARDAGRRIVAIGTTTARVLEHLGGKGRLAATTGSTDLFITPGYAWRVVDVLVTNFHLPKSTLLVLVCALAGTERLLTAYREAVAAGYRFFSYGDACWIQRA